MTRMKDFHFGANPTRKIEIWTGWGSEHSSDRYADAERSYDLFAERGEILSEVPAQISPFQAGKSRRLWKATRKVLQSDTPNYPQHEGSCVAFGAKNASEYVQCVEILSGEDEEFHPIFPPYLYGTGRVYVGKNQIPGDGSFGSWQMVACAKYGFLRSDEKDVPEYPKQRPSGITLGQKWGADDKDWKQFVPLAQPHSVDEKLRIQSVEELCRMLVAGYPCTIASDQGFTFKPDQNGIHRPRGTWYHQMCFTGVIWNSGKPFAVILNSWGDVHGRVSDPETDEELPAGSLLVEVDYRIERMVSQGECYPYSNFQGFPDRSKPLDEVEYDLF